MRSAELRRYAGGACARERLPRTSRAATSAVIGSTRRAASAIGGGASEAKGAGRMTFALPVSSQQVLAGPSWSCPEGSWCSACASCSAASLAGCSTSHAAMSPAGGGEAAEVAIRQPREREDRCDQSSISDVAKSLHRSSIASSDWKPPAASIASLAAGTSVTSLAAPVPASCGNPRTHRLPSPTVPHR